MLDLSSCCSDGSNVAVSGMLQGGGRGAPEGRVKLYISKKFVPGIWDVVAVWEVVHFGFDTF